MGVIIGHASIDENRRSSGGIAGDQTGKELCTRSWYSKNWNYALRPKDSIKAELMAQACEKACNNVYIGYDQSQRNTLRTQAIAYGYDLARIQTFCECDCSSLMAVCAECAGIAIPYSGSNAPTTTTMKSAFINTGAFELLTDSKYLTTDSYLKRGDILVKSGFHTVMVLSNGTGAKSAVNKAKYSVGRVYTTDANLYIRKAPYGDKMKHSSITVNAQEMAYFDEYGYAILRKGTRVSCMDIKELDNSTWLLIPSGWICASENGKDYVK